MNESSLLKRVIERRAILRRALKINSVKIQAPAMNYLASSMQQLNPYLPV